MVCTWLKLGRNVLTAVTGTDLKKNISCKWAHGDFCNVCSRNIPASRSSIFYRYDRNVDEIKIDSDSDLLSHDVPASGLWF